jgi:hypothetical protein
VKIPEPVTTIYHGAFRGCYTIREVKLPKTLKYIGNYAFAFLSERAAIDIPQGWFQGDGRLPGLHGASVGGRPDSTLRIGNDCFYGCKNFERFVIGNGVVDLGRLGAAQLRPPV